MAPSDHDSFDESPGGAFFESPGAERGLATMLLFGGSFLNVGAAPCLRLAQMDPVTLAVSQVGAGVSSGSVFALARWKNKIVIGGSFDEGAGKRFIMTWDGSTFEALDTGVTSANVGDKVNTILIDGDDILIGGQFTEVDGVACYGTARYTDSTGTWGPYLDIDSGGTLGICFQLYKDGGDIYMLGDFDNVEGVAINAKAKNGGAWNLASGPTGTGYCVGAQAYNGRVYTGFTVTAIDGDNAQRIASGGGGDTFGNSYWKRLGNPVISTDGISAAPSQSGVPMAVYQGKLYITGEFLDADGLSAVNRIVAYDSAETGSYYGFSKLATGFNGRGFGLYPYGGKLFAMGEFTSPASRCAKWDGSAWASVAGFDGNVHCAGELVIS